MGCGCLPGSWRLLRERIGIFFFLLFLGLACMDSGLGTGSGLRRARCSPRGFRLDENALKVRQRQTDVDAGV